MQRQAFGALVAAAVTAFVATGAQAAGQAATAAKAGKCVHNCQGYADCKGNGSNSCKGKNDCANTGLVPKACSSQTTAKACTQVLDKLKNKMCTWNEG